MHTDDVSDDAAMAVAVRANGASVTMTCRVCGNVVVIAAGETLHADDERVCAHIAVSRRPYSDRPRRQR